MNQVRKEILDTLLHIRKTKKEVQRTLNRNIAYNNGKNMISVANPVREYERKLIKCEEYLYRLLRLKEDLDERLKRNSFKTRGSDDEVNLYIMHLEAKLDNKEK